MRWSRSRWVREAHFASSLLLALVLLFFAATGFMAQHREWFHERVDRDDLAGRLGDPPCDAASLAEAGGVVPAAVERIGDWWFVDGQNGSRLGCRAGAPGVQEGVVIPWPAGVVGEVHAWREAWEQREQRRLDTWSPGAEAMPRTWFRTSDVWRVRTFEVDPARERVIVWDLDLPLAMSLIEIHRGRGATEVLVDIAAVLVALVVLTGVLHGLRCPGAKRRALWVLVAGSLALVVGLLLG